MLPASLLQADMARPLWLAAGLLFVGLGAIGAFLPLLPTVPLLLLAAFCFARGNPAWEARLLAHPKWGPPLVEWRHRRAIGRPAKRAAVLALAISVGVTVLTLGFPWAWLTLGLALTCGTWIWTRPE